MNGNVNFMATIYTVESKVVLVVVVVVVMLPLV